MVQKHGGTNSQVVRTKEEAEELWSDRKNAHYHHAGLALAAWGEEVADECW
jgi:D-lactate dehydrogenase (cytochrome)